MSHMKSSLLNFLAQLSHNRVSKNKLKYILSLLMTMIGEFALWTCYVSDNYHHLQLVYDYSLNDKYVIRALIHYLVSDNMWLWGPKFLQR